MENKKDYNNSPTSFRQSIEGFGNDYESIFQKAMKLCILMNLEDESKIAAKKIISYNPLNQELADSFPEYEKVAHFVSNLILNKIQLLTQHHNNESITKNHNQNPNSLLNDEKNIQDNQLQFLQNLNETKSNDKNQKDCKGLSTSAIPWQTLGNCYLLLGDFPNAFAALSQYFQLNYKGSFDYHPNHFNNQPPNTLSDNDFFFWFLFGVINAHFKYHQNAIKCFQNFLLNIERAANSTKLIINDVETSLQFLPEMKYETTFRMGISYRLLDRYDDSLKSFLSISATPPNKLKVDDTLFQIAYSYQIKNEFTRAQNIYKDIYQRHPENINILIQFGWACITRYMFDNKNNISFFNEGLNLLLSALKQCQTDPLILFLLGKTMMIKEDYQVAYSYFKKCINYWTDFASFWCDLGVLYCKNKQYQDAIVAFQRAVYLSSDLSEAWLNLGTVFEKMGQYLNAKKIYLTAKNIIKSDKEGLLDERVQLLQDFENNRGNKIDNDVIYLQNDHDFVQLPVEFSNNYIAAVPRILPACIGISDAQTDINLEALSSYPKTMF